MKSKILSLCMATALSVTAASAQSFVETFDANSLGWTESAGESNSGTAIIDKGVMTIKSKGDSKFMRFAANVNGFAKGGENTAFETHCYAPLDVKKGFEIVANVKMDNLDLERQAGMIFNYRDFGNYYAFVFNKESVYSSVLLIIAVLEALHRISNGESRKRQTKSGMEACQRQWRTRILC